MREGTIIRAAGGFFAIRDHAGREYLCRARGVLKRGAKNLMVGDRVLFVAASEPGDSESGAGVIEKMQPRKNILARPTVANVDQLLVVMALKNPQCDWQLVSRMLVLAEKEGLAVLFCLNKTDLVDEADRTVVQEKLVAFPYQYYFTSALNHTGIDDLRHKLSDRCTVLAGPSGAGKSSLLNAVEPGFFLKTGTISSKIGRGRHTTRQVELLALQNGGSVVDTPGFYRLNFKGMRIERLDHFFPEFEPWRANCAFRNCLHLTEPQCAVRQEIGKTVNPMRYDHYRTFIEELNEEEAY